MSLIVLLALFAQEWARPLGHESFDVRQAQQQFLERTRLGLVTAWMQSPNKDPEIERRLNRFNLDDFKYRIKLFVLIFFLANQKEEKWLFDTLPFPADDRIDQIERMAERNPERFHDCAVWCIDTIDLRPQVERRLHMFYHHRGDGNTGFTARLLLNRIAYVRLGYSKIKQGEK